MHLTLVIICVYETNKLLCYLTDLEVIALLNKCDLAAVYETDSPCIRTYAKHLEKSVPYVCSYTMGRNTKWCI